MLREVTQKRDCVRREDFLDNSGLDLFYLESLERKYFEGKNLDLCILDSIQENKTLPGFGGGERI